jgi:methionyl-tRNA synthetase
MTEPKIDLNKEVPLSDVALPPEVLAQRETFVKHYTGGSESAAVQPCPNPEPCAEHPRVWPEVGTPTITAEEFGKVELRVGTVIAAEPIKKAKKMLKLTVDLGEPAPRTILAGIALSFNAGSLVGGRFVFVTNLPPREMFGLKSEGMILAAGEPEHLVLVRPDGVVANGARFH